MYCKKETGQALPLGIAFLMSTILLGLVLFNTGQTASEKSRLVNAADAAAYSGLIWQARALNYQAYTNRAMVANQVSIGQMVSLTSWTQYAYIVARNIDYIGDWFPIVKPYTQAAESITSMIDSVMVNIAEAFVSVIDSVNGVLSQSQQAVFMASFAATPGIVREVVERNDSRYSVDTAYAVIGMGQNAVNWNNFTERYENNQGLLRKADVINRSKDEFTNSRNLRTGDMLPGAPNRLDLGIIRVWIKKEGRTNLISEESSTGSNLFQSNNSTSNLEWEWKAKYTLSFHIEVWDCDHRGCGWDHDEIPLGWGSRYVNGDFECDDSQYSSSNWWGWFFYNDGCPRYMQENRWAERLANMEKEELDADYEGIRAYYDLQDLSQTNRDPRLVLRIEVELPQNHVRTASKIDGLGSDSVPSEELRTGIGQGMFGTQDQMVGNGLAAISTGELFFHPPDDYNPSRRTGRYEITSLFNPYWEVKLADTPYSNRFMAWALRDSSLLSDSASGVAAGIQHYIGEREEELQRLLALEESLQEDLNRTTDPVRRADLVSELATVDADINQLQNMDYNTGLVQNNLQHGIEQGISSAAQTQVGRYEQMLEQYAHQQADQYVDQFEDEIVDQVTDQLEQALEDAVEEALESAITSFF
ncbi:MAG: Tad domain-containing protein [Candidatus Thiodiazotropha sp. (ex Ctena orbiculata)]|nr:Tad domain-containing protein [Candidatus Thiodiazotropha taylori]MBT2998267.1 Tad domain-containing protein [Candidatus Thiodiazotropha taylori]MBT3002622.1 Tad domain-containing protein [Candidatus Thiodiazotropha taylori]MBV2105987.1 Tad domain-containing protein [Candidatus Thiodiazotropha taylori]MBV2110080.1 Tad domain-containing protein [Candidatus Thiodiazotropha taylori]